MPPTQSGEKATFSDRFSTCSISSRRRATSGRRLIDSTGLPFGRPRCEHRMTLALWRNAYSMVGSVSRMRVSSEITPSFRGTLKSTRMSTRLWASSRSRIDSFGIWNKHKFFCCLWELIVMRYHMCARSLRTNDTSARMASGAHAFGPKHAARASRMPAKHLNLDMATALPTTLGALRASEFTPARVGRSVKDELRENLIARLRANAASDSGY